MYVRVYDIILVGSDYMNNLQFHQIDKNMSNGLRMYGKDPLTDEEINFIKKEIQRIEAFDDVFVFNDKKHLSYTCYNSGKDIVYVGRNVFPDTKYGSFHPRDLMSVGAVLAHEYYGHRTYRQEYLDDVKSGKVSTLEWEDECRASITAARIGKGLTAMDRSYLIQDAIKRAEEFGQWIELDDFMKEVLYYGRTEPEKHIIGRSSIIKYVRATSQNGNVGKRQSNSNLSEMSKSSKSGYTR